MKTNLPAAPDLAGPSDELIREYAYHLYEQDGCVAGHEVEHWLEARACLRANIPATRSRLRLHEHIAYIPAPASLPPGTQKLLTR